MATYPGKDIEREANAPCAACEQATLTPAEAAAAAWAGPAARIIAVEPESPADDAVHIDSTAHYIEEVIEQICTLAREAR